MTLATKLPLAMKGKLGLKIIGATISSLSDLSKSQPQDRRPLQPHPPDTFVKSLMQRWLAWQR
jgi:hypothetical protein